MGDLPVSYTHLDVYKRQVVGLLPAVIVVVAVIVAVIMRMRRSMIVALAVRVRMAMIAVSYTHLDVYKRQTLKTIAIRH